MVCHTVWSLPKALSPKTGRPPSSAVSSALHPVLSDLMSLKMALPPFLTSASAKFCHSASLSLAAALLWEATLRTTLSMSLTK